MGFQNKNMPSKIVLVFAFAILICLFFTGCNNNNDNPVSANNGNGNDNVMISKTRLGKIKYNLTTNDTTGIVTMKIIVPENYPIEITDYELLTKDDKIINKRTNINNPIEFIALIKQQLSDFTIKLYNNDELVANCKIVYDDGPTGYLEFDSDSQLKYHEYF